MRGICWADIIPQCCAIGIATSSHVKTFCRTHDKEEMRSRHLIVLHFVYGRARVQQQNMCLARRKSWVQSLVFPIKRSQVGNDVKARNVRNPEQPLPVSMANTDLNGPAAWLAIRQLHVPISLSYHYSIIYQLGHLAYNRRRSSLKATLIH